MQWRQRSRFQHRCTHENTKGDGLRLSDLVPGQRARILRVGGRGRIRRRFMEMGFVNGETIVVERVAPLGDPVEFFIKGYHVSLRRHDAQNIEVQMVRESPKGDA